MRWTPLFALLIWVVPATAQEETEVPEEEIVEEPITTDTVVEPKKAPGGYLEAATLAVEAQLKRGDIKAGRKDFDGAIAEYRKAIALYEKAIERAAPKAPAGKGSILEAAAPKAPPPAPTNDGTPEGRKKLAEYYVRILSDKKASDQLRYNAAVQLGELAHVAGREALMRAVEHDKFQVARRAAAWSLGRLGADAVPAIPVLIAQVGGDKEYVGYMAVRALGDITEKTLRSRVQFGFKPAMSKQERQQIQQKWEAWYAENEKALKASKGEK